MIFNVAQLALLALAATAIAKENAAASSSDMECILGCAEYAGKKANCNYLDKSCSCDNQVFRKEAKKCVKDRCSSEDVKEAERLDRQRCAN